MCPINKRVMSFTDDSQVKNKRSLGHNIYVALRDFLDLAQRGRDHLNKPRSISPQAAHGGVGREVQACNLAKARRCGARTRAGHPCKQAAVRDRARCRMHGGARGSGGPRGNRNGNFKHGLWTAESIGVRRAIGARVREIRAQLRATGRRR